MHLVLATALGFCLAACAGLRAFLPLFLLGLAYRAGESSDILGSFELLEQYRWVVSDQALMTLGVASAIEVLADKIPLLDHGLDSLGTFVRPAAGGAGVLAIFNQEDPLIAYSAALIMAGTTTLPVHLARSGTRVGTNAMTGGLSAPIVSTMEDFTTVLVMAGAIFFPLLMFGFVIGLFWLITAGMKAMRRIRKEEASASTA